MLKVHVVGGGAAGLYFAVLARHQDQRREIVVWEQAPEPARRGWGIVIQDPVKQHLQALGEPSYRRFAACLAAIPQRQLFHKETEFHDPRPYHDAVDQPALLRFLTDECRARGVAVRFGEAVTPDRLERLRDADLVVAADGLDSPLRESLADHLGVEVRQGRNKYVWLGVGRAFEGFKALICKSEHGAVVGHGFPFAAERSTLIVEMTPETWSAAGLDRDAADAAGISRHALEWLEEVFAPHLCGARLLATDRGWRSFPQLFCRRWHHGNVVLLGDAAHASHFSKGMGTLLAFEDAAALATALVRDEPRTSERLAAYQRKRESRVKHFQKAAAAKMKFFEDVDAFVDLSAESFATLVHDPATGGGD